MARPRYVFGDGCGLCSEPAICAIGGVPIGAKCQKNLGAIMRANGWRDAEIRAYFARCSRVQVNRICVDCGKIFAEPKRAGPPRLRCPKHTAAHERQHNRSRRARDRPRIEPIPLAAGA